VAVAICDLVRCGGPAQANYDETIAFYRDVVGLPVVDEFNGSFRRGTARSLGLPDTSVQMEIVRAQATTGAVGGSTSSCSISTTLPPSRPRLPRCATTALATAPVAAPDWRANGAVIYRDPDGRDVVFRAVV